MEGASFLDGSFSKRVEFPIMFSASSKINVSFITLLSGMYSRHVKSETRKVPVKKYSDLEKYMTRVIERHVESVPPALGSRNELKAEILNGMTATWILVSPQFQHNW
jgi:hypothetical protein